MFSFKTWEKHREIKQTHYEGHLQRLGDEESWNCTVAFEKEIAPGATWTQMNCSSKHFYLFEELPIGPLVFNVVDVDLTADNLLVTPAQVCCSLYEHFTIMSPHLTLLSCRITKQANQSTTYKLQTIPEMAQQNPNFIAGMNGSLLISNRDWASCPWLTTIITIISKVDTSGSWIIVVSKTTFVSERPERTQNSQSQSPIPTTVLVRDDIWTNRSMLYH